MGFPEAVLEALALLTHDDAMPYLDYVARLRSNPIARKVKRADLAHNSDEARLNEIGPADRKRLEKYRLAAELL